MKCPVRAKLNEIKHKIRLSRSYYLLFCELSLRYSDFVIGNITWTTINEKEFMENIQSFVEKAYIRAPIVSKKNPTVDTELMKTPLHSRSPHTALWESKRLGCTQWIWFYNHSAFLYWGKVNCELVCNCHPVFSL